jgi:hypothetical protein
VSFAEGVLARGAGSEGVGGGGVPVACPHASSVEVEDKTFVYDERLHTMMVLNPTAAAIWAGCDGRRTIDQLAEDLAATFREDLDRVRTEVLATVTKLADLGLVEVGRGEPVGDAIPG